METAKINSKMWLIAAVFTLSLPYYALINLGFISVNPIRIFLIISAFASVWHIRNINFIDVLVFLFSVWLVVCTLYNYGFDAGFGKSGFLFIETFFAYLFGRIFITKIPDFTDFCKYLLVAAIILALLSIPEAIFRRRFIAEATNLIFSQNYLDQDDIRYGILRARTVFSHQILFGIFCSFMICLVFTVVHFKNLSARLLASIPLVVGIAMSVSATAIMVLMLTAAALMVERYTRQIENRNVYITLGLSLFVIISELFVGGGVFGIINRYLSVSSTGYYRIEIWNWGWINIFENPVFGMIGEEWRRWPWMRESIDNFYIKVGIYYGLVGLMTLAIILISSFISMIRFNSHIANSQLRFILFGWWLAFIGFIIAAMSVDLFGQSYALLFIWIGMGQALIIAARKLPAGYIRHASPPQPFQNAAAAY